MTTPLIEWFGKLDPRERLMVGGGGTLAVILGLGLFVIMPAFEARASAKTAIEEKEALIDWLAPRAAEAAALKAQQSDMDLSGALALAEIEASLEAAGLRNGLVRLTPSTDRGFEAQWERVSYTALLGWVSSLQARFGLTITGIAIEPADAPGLVDASLTAMR